MPALTARDADANNMFGAFNFLPVARPPLVLQERVRPPSATGYSNVDYDD
jgi:hypothetical protein